MLDLPERDPSEHLRVAIYKYTKDDIPWIVAEAEPQGKFPNDTYLWHCRFCKYQSYRNLFMLNHIYDEHLNGK